MIRLLILAALSAVTVAGCSSTPSAPPPVATPAPRVGTALTMAINAPVLTVRETIVTRARQRGTAAKLADARSVVLERSLADTPAALAEQCGAHKPGRIVRIVLSTIARGARTEVSERRFIVDTDGGNCPVTLTDVEAADGTRSLADLKAQAESQGIQR
ncbi:MAG: hypothetical protein FD175_989 [Beijerinckiaceae bacterium]|nr:MAG: hypothetical protein FD175_989 [Beijerinckiaceae bacterium]